MAINWQFWKTKAEPATRSFDVPEKVFIEKGKGYEFEYSEQERNHMLALLDDLIEGEYSSSNFIELFYCVPEVFAPVHEIASRVADANWQLCKLWNDEVDYNNADFNRIFSQPNPVTEMRDFIYHAVCYEILTGKQIWYFNSTTVFGEDIPKNLISWWNLPAHRVLADIKKDFDYYTSNKLEDFVNRYKMPFQGKTKYFETKDIQGIFHTSLRYGVGDLNKCISLLRGASKAIKNLIPVYEARGTIYVKRGMMGAFVSRKKDASGSVALTKPEKKAVNDEMNAQFGLTGGRQTVGIIGEDVDFVQTAMSIKEMEPFEETLSDAVAIYATLRIPRHLVPSKDTSTFDNANTDITTFYEDVIIPWGAKYAAIFTNKFKFDRRYIKASYAHIKVLQGNKKELAETEKTYSTTWLERWKNSACSLNEWITHNDGIPGTGPMFEKKLLEMTPEELAIAQSIIKTQSVNNGTDQQQVPGADKAPKKKGTV